MSEKNYISIGRTRKTHGLLGELKVVIEPRFLEDFLKTEMIFLELRGKKVPYFIESARNGAAGADALVKFEEIDDLTAAQGIAQKEIFMRESDLLADEEREIEVPEKGGYGYCEGYKIMDKTLGEVGVIESVAQLPQGDMAILKYKGKEVMAPLVAAFIEKVDIPSRTVFTDFPEGLLD